MKKFTKKMKKETRIKGIYNLNIINYHFMQLIKSGRKNKVLKKSKIKLSYNNDTWKVVPIFFSKKILSLFDSKNKKLVIIKGDLAFHQKI